MSKRKRAPKVKKKRRQSGRPHVGVPATVIEAGDLLATLDLVKSAGVSDVPTIRLNDTGSRFVAGGFLGNNSVVTPEHEDPTGALNLFAQIVVADKPCACGKAIDLGVGSPPSITACAWRLKRTEPENGGDWYMEWVGDCGASRHTVTWS